MSMFSRVCDGEISLLLAPARSGQRLEIDFGVDQIDIAVALHHFNQTNGLLLHADHQFIDATLQKAMKEDCRNSHDKARRGTDQRLGDTTDEYTGIGRGPELLNEPKISIMPSTVPSKPSSGAMAAIEPSALR